MSSSDSRRQEVTEQMWYAAEDYFRSVQRRLEKLGRRRLRVGYEEQTVHETKRNADAFETQTLQWAIVVYHFKTRSKDNRPTCWNEQTWVKLDHEKEKS